MHSLSQTGAVLVAGIGSAVLFGWIFDVPLLKSMLPSLITMRINTAVCFMAAGVALWLLQKRHPNLLALARGLALLVVVVGTLSLAEDLMGMNFGIDEFLMRDPAPAAETLHPGRMAPLTGANFFLMGVALLGLKADRVRRAFAWECWLALIVTLTSLMAVIGYAYHVVSLYKVGPYSWMALHTALAFFILSISFLAAVPTFGIINLAISDTAGGVVVRRLLPTIPLILFGVGWATLAGKNAGYYDSQVHLALLIVLSITISILAVSATAAKLRTVDVQWKRAEAELVALNADLEKRVLERTQELERSLAEVKQLSGLLPICAWCKKIRDDNDYWQTVENYVTAKTDAHFTHSICPDCRDKMLPGGPAPT